MIDVFISLDWNFQNDKDIVDTSLKYYSNISSARYLTTIGSYITNIPTTKASKD